MITTLLLVGRLTVCAWVEKGRGDPSIDIAKLGCEQVIFRNHVTHPRANFKEGLGCGRYAFSPSPFF